MGIKRDVPESQDLQGFGATIRGEPLRQSGKGEERSGSPLGKKSLMQSQVFATGGRAMMKTWRDWRFPSRVVFFPFGTRACAAWLSKDETNKGPCYE